MKKRLFTLFLAICMVLTLLPFAAFAAGTRSGVCGDNASWELKDGVLTISGTGTVEKGGEWWDYDIKSVVVNKGITAIGDGAFVYEHSGKYSVNEKIESVKLPNGIKSIGNDAFYMCGALKSINIPDTVKSIGDCAFEDCWSLEKMTLPSSVTSIGAGAFEGCSSLKSINIPYGVTDIGNHTFGGCESLESISLPGSVMGIGDEAFMQCESLKSVKLSNGLKAIGDDAFLWCYCLESVNIPNTVKSIGDGAFNSCGSLEKMTIPASVTSIGDGAFGGSGIKSITIPDGITSIGDSTFRNCWQLKTVNIPQSVKSIGVWAFLECYSLESIRIPESVTLIDRGAFLNCSNLKDVYYHGSEAKWNKITINKETSVADDVLKNATKHFNSHDYKNGACTICGAKEPLKPVIKNPFKDVKKGDFFYDPVLWAVDKGVTSGVDATHFAPSDDCTRGQIVTFLWRANGCPAPKTTKNPFKDVKKGAFYYDAVLWAVENGITAGVDKTHFAPNDTCTRGQAVTFQWRANDEPTAAISKCPFKDVSKSAFYYKAMMWAVGENITNGIDTTHFAPNDTCTRGQIVTFLYRDMK